MLALIFSTMSWTNDGPPTPDESIPCAQVLEATRLHETAGKVLQVMPTRSGAT